MNCKPVNRRVLSLLVAMGVLAGGNICPSDCTGDEVACSREHLCCIQAEESCCHQAHRAHLEQPRTLLGAISQIGLKLTESFPVGPCGCCRSHQGNSPADPKDTLSPAHAFSPANPERFAHLDDPARIALAPWHGRRDAADHTPLYLRLVHLRN